MAIFPVVQSPCPYKRNLSAVMDGDFCRMCKRTVTDLTAMNDDQKIDFFKACSGEVCVSYRLPIKPALTAAALAVAGIPMMAAAQTADTDAVAAESAADDEMMIIVGGIRDTKNVDFVDDKADPSQLELPTVYDDEPEPLDKAVTPVK
jgi:predicted Fe-S protein YdhL (DUF1289 family)